MMHVFSFPQASYSFVFVKSKSYEKLPAVSFRGTTLRVRWIRSRYPGSSAAGLVRLLPVPTGTAPQPLQRSSLPAKEYPPARWPIGPSRCPPRRRTSKPQAGTPPFSTTRGPWVPGMGPASHGVLHGRPTYCTAGTFAAPPGTLGLLSPGSLPPPDVPGFIASPAREDRPPRLRFHDSTRVCSARASPPAPPPPVSPGWVRPAPGATRLCSPLPTAERGYLRRWRQRRCLASHPGCTPTQYHHGQGRSGTTPGADYGRRNSGQAAGQAYARYAVAFHSG